MAADIRPQKRLNITTKEHNHPYKKLSIQVRLNGLSFFVLDTIANTVILRDGQNFKEEQTPYAVLKALKSLFQKHQLTAVSFEDITVIHSNPMFALVPEPFFDKNELPNYLKFNTKLLANDQIVHDALPNHDMVCVYVPFTNINNYIFDCFGSFDFKHGSFLTLQTLFAQSNNGLVCYAYVDHHHLELVVLEQKKLLLYNQFQFHSEEDFLYYVLFTYEQLGLSTETVDLKLFGIVEEGDSLFKRCSEYFKNIRVFLPKSDSHFFYGSTGSDFDLTILNN